MPRKATNIYKRKDGRWEARYPAGRNPNGSVKYHSVYAKSYSKVKDKLLIASTTATLQPQKPKLIFSDLLKMWISSNSIKQKASTKLKYENIIEKHINPELGGHTLQKLKPPLLKPIEILNRKDQQTLENALLSDLSPINIGILLTLNTGMRLGEICALQWKDIDLENRIIHIRSNVIRIKNTDPDSTAKTVLILDTLKRRHPPVIFQSPVKCFLY